MNNDITIGFDLGNKKHKVVGLDDCGKIILKCELSNDKETPGAFFNEHAGATVAMETGTHCRWISSLARRCGCDAIVGNARKLRAIWGSSQKNDWKDAQMMRKLLVAAASYILRESSKDPSLKRYGGRICARGGKIARRKAKVAVARKLAVVMMAMLQSRKPYQDSLAARTDAAEPARI